MKLGDVKPHEEAGARENFFLPLLNAWNVLAYDRYKPGSGEERFIGSLLSELYQQTTDPTITLSGRQIDVIDALTEVAGIPHQKRQSKIPIPDKLLHYNEWILSEEYHDRLTRATKK